MIWEKNIEGQDINSILAGLNGDQNYILLPGDHIITSIGGTLYQGMVVAHPGYSSNFIESLKEHGEWCDRSVHYDGVDTSPECIHVDYYTRAFSSAGGLYTMTNFVSVDTYGADPRLTTYGYPFDFVSNDMIPSRFGKRHNSIETKSNYLAICKKCNAKNDYAEPNQKDGSYVCFECR